MYIYRSSALSGIYGTSCVVRRFVQFGVADATQGNNVSEPINTLPTSTGNGPFAEMPKFSALGLPASLLSVLLPASGILNTRCGSIIAANGDLSQLTSEVVVHDWKRNPFLYQRVTASEQPMSLLVAPLISGASFATIHVKNQTWVVNNKDSIIAWSGSSLELSSANLRTLVSGKNLSNFTSISTSGQGTLAVSGQGQLFTMNLKSGESMLINPGSVIAHTVEAQEEASRIVFHRLKSQKFSFLIPEFSAVDKYVIRAKEFFTEFLAKIQEPTKDEPTMVEAIGSPTPAQLEEKHKADELLIRSSEHTTVTGSLFDKTKEMLKRSYNNFTKAEIYYEVNGPVTLLVQNNVSFAKENFSKQELTRVYETIREK
ncbi:hypothetical protein BABINDRAFT_7394 [Babjeviella inositovora NRRL Y-12698]|uniref:Altered inheritance of mitochondria protein 24, mitochondrial n=1 Tax=Babjeviella inositovora NRRL Y-12698 TaxID=984486 RepID=A0A1E3QSP5_9ASCO|nr:uncharacterized protein BABINDRAFT_7394 [Babjeviella inositovora NRRL Y-12698]ODQ80690.1 hypothetical protein BABINDRAFT_7394 [Babjeviella inositovora NRRL Y-12698]